MERVRPKLVRSKPTTTTSKAPALAVAALLATLTIADLDALAARGARRGTDGEIDGDGASDPPGAHGEILARLRAWRDEVVGAVNAICDAFADPRMEGAPARMFAADDALAAVGLDLDEGPAHEAGIYMNRLYEEIAVVTRGAFVACDGRVPGKGKGACGYPVPSGADLCELCSYYAAAEVRS